MLTPSIRWRISFTQAFPGIIDPHLAPDLAGNAVKPSGAVVVRPDGFVGWRAVEAAGEPEEALRQALRSLLCRGDGKP
jgi:hypothetical protein